MFDYSRGRSPKYSGDVYILVYTVDASWGWQQPTKVTSSSHAHGPLGLVVAVSAYADQQFGTNFHRIREAQTLGNSLNVGLRAVECVYGRTLTEGAPYKWTHLLTYLLFWISLLLNMLCTSSVKQYYNKTNNSSSTKHCLYSHVSE